MPFHRNEIILGGSRQLLLPLTIPGLAHWSEAINPANTLSTAGVAGTGTTVAQTGNTLTGVATKFLSEVRVGDLITAALGLSGNVTAIASDTSLTLDSSATIGAETPYTITPVAGLSDRVTTLGDLSGLGNTHTQATFANKPSLTSAAAGISGKRSFLYDNGLTDILLSSNYLSGSVGTVVVVYSLSASIPDAVQVAVASADDGTANTYLVRIMAYRLAATPNTAIVQVNNDTADQVRGSVALSAGTRYILMSSSLNTAYESIINNATETLTIITGSNAGDWFADTPNRDNVAIGGLYQGGAGFLFRGMMAAVLIYDGVTLTSQNKSDLYNFCASRY